MEHIARILFPNGNQAPVIEIATDTDLQSALHRLDLDLPRRTLVLVGGAGKMSGDDLARLRVLFDHVLGPLTAAYGMVVVDGGTDVGIMRLAGEARSRLTAKFDLIGVAATGTVIVPGRPEPSPEAASLEPHHSHFVLVPGSEWGDEALWIAQVASLMAADRPSVTVLINGGEIAWQDVAESTHRGRPVIVMAGSGRTADVLARATLGEKGDPRADRLIATGLIRAVDLAGGLRQVVAMLADALELPHEEAMVRIRM